jgi:hypothetical protein
MVRSTLAFVGSVAIVVSLELRLARALGEV